MTTPDTEGVTALQELLDERQRYQGWLRALEQRRTATPAHVYERVHTDYALRLERVMQRLRERAEQLSATIEGMQSRLQALRSREADRADERHEFELRAAVGELSPDEWERRRTDADRELGSIADDRRQIEGELAELQRVVALTRETPAVAAPAAEPERVREPEPAPPPAAQAQPAPEPPPRGEEGAPSTVGERPLAAAPSGDSPSIDDFIAEWPLRQMGSEGTGTAGGSDLRTGNEAPSAAPATATWHPPISDNARGPAAPQTSSQGAPGPEDEQPTHDLHEHHVGEGRRDMDKTLKCPECGAMNYATEWYCERCGGELASF